MLGYGARMRTLLLAGLLASSLGACSSARDRDAVTDRAAKVSTVSVDELDRMLASHACRPVDANGSATRQRMGVIPGAILLGDNDVLDNLPADKNQRLVFYCANPACGASHEAAAKAILAGYTQVKVLPDGIAGWVKAGKKTASL
jgi:rhodanese-related sulfurtransferase